MKKLLALSLALALTLSLMACGKKDEPSNPGSNDSNDPSTSAPEYTIRYSHGNSEGSLVYMVAEYFADTLEEKTNGRIKVDVYPSGQLSSGDDEAMTNLMSGAYEMSPAAPSALAKYSNMPEYNILDFPYMFDGVDESQKVIQSDMWKDLDAKFEKTTGVRPLVWYSTGSNAVGNSKHAITTPDDFKGLKLRVSNDPVMNGMVEGLGANPTVVSFGELYSALQTGVVDGAEQPIANYKSNAFPEVANNLILDGHTLGAVQAVITDNAWGKLTENQQAAIMEAGADTQAFNADLSETAENKVLEELRSSGCNVVDVDDKTPWQEACAKVIKDNTSDQAELYQKLLDMKA